MCGLFGMAGLGIQKQDISFLKQLGLVSQLRGTHGFGLINIEHRGIEFSKDCYDFNACLEFEPRLIESIMTRAYVGHVRHATVGKLTKDNTHPFDFDNFIGMHNGTLVDDAYTIDLDKTDSEQMFATIDELVNEGMTIEEALVEVFGNLDDKSAYAVTLVDKSNNDIIFARNHRRPMAFAMNKHRAVKYWASEVDMLEYVLDRNGIEYGNLIRPDPHQIIRLPLSSIKPASVKNSDAIYQVTKVPYTPPVKEVTKPKGGTWKPSEVKDKTAKKQGTPPQYISGRCPVCWAEGGHEYCDDCYYNLSM